jgi:hypothetical protein
VNLTALRVASALLCLVTLTACDSSNFGQSCGGADVLVCRAYEWAEVAEATVTPSELGIADFSQMATIHVALDRCDSAPAAHDVALSAVVPEPMGENVEVFNLLTLREGEDGDPVAGDGVIDVEIANPLGSSIPPNRDIRLRFEAVSRGPSGCASGALEIPYRTGPAS